MKEEDRMMMRGARVGALVAAGLLAMGLSAGCTDLADSGPQVVSVTVTPDTLSASNAGMTDEFFQVTIVTTGFDSPVTDARVTIQDVDREGEPQEAVSVSGDTVVIPQIAKSWFGGLAPGSYPLEVQVSNEVDEVRQANAATVTVTP